MVLKTKAEKPPGLFLKFFRWYCQPVLRDPIEGDLMELYQERVKEFGKRTADRKFIADVLLLFRPGIIRSIEGHRNVNTYGMYKNYFKVGVRNILKYKMFSFINVFGLAVAMSVCMLIILMLADQHRYDQFHGKKDRVYRILSSTEGGRQPYATSPCPLASELKNEYPVVEETTSLTPGIGGDALYQQKLVEMRGYFADPAFFKVFSFKLEEGNPYHALAKPNTMVISSQIAHKLFNGENPVGKVIEFSDRQLSFPIESGGQGSPAVSWGSFTITGVIDESKYKSHLKFDVLVSSATRPALYAEKKLEDFSSSWEWYFRTYTYALVAEGKSAEDLSLALNNLVNRKYASIKSEQTKGFRLTPQRLNDIQLGLVANDTNNRLPREGYYFLASLALVVMVLACLNYTNLSVARTLTRAKEIGVRKVTGAGRTSLVFQFLTESVITSMLALAMAIIILMVIKPAFMNLWVNKYLQFDLPLSTLVYLVFVGFAVLIGLIAGLYPAWHVSTYRPVQALKHLNFIKPGKLGLRKALSISQFVISLFFITTSILIYDQFKHFMRFDYGFQSANIVNVELQGADYRKLSHEFSTIPGVSAVSACDLIPAIGGNNGIELKRPGSGKEFMQSNVMIADENFLPNLGLKLVAGNNLTTVDSTDRFIVVNEETVRQLGYANPAEIVGEVLESKYSNELVQVAGVVENFRYELLINRDEIRPLVLQNRPSRFKYLNIQIGSSDLMGTVEKLEAKWNTVDPIHPFHYEFYDSQLASTHQGIFDMVSIIGFIAFLAIVIACLGLLGMTTYAAERRTKEVGIRKVMGAEDRTIAWMLSASFLKLLAVSTLIGAPFSYFVNNLWLQNFPNRVEFGLDTMLGSAVIMLTLGLLTIGSQTWSVAKRNPVNSLRME